MSDIVVDATVGVMTVIPEEQTPQAIALFRDAQRLGDRLVAPYALPIEVTNAIRRYMRRERLPLSLALALLARFLGQPVELASDPDLHFHALRLTDAFSLGGHDAHYVALAQLLGCEMWTGDQRLLRAIAGRLPYVKYIGDYPTRTDRSSA